MKKTIISISLLLAAGILHAQTTPSTTENYVYTKTYLSDPTSSTPKTSETVQYFDGLGRPKQVVNIKASPTGKDVVNHIEYDPFGRQAKDYLPVPQSGTQNGAVYTSPLSNAAAQYGAEKIYAEKVLENSPLDRLQQQIQVGNDWAAKPVNFEYATNASGEVKKFITTTTWVNNITSSTISPATDPNSENGNYKAAQLYKNTVADEDGNTTIEFKNGQGQVILVRKVLSATEKADTYYIYNEYDQLAFVIPPLASVSASLDQATLDNLCYQYRYDGRNRLVEKKVPGKGWEYMVYDKQDRLVMTQDANMQPSGKWLFTKYDKFSRPVYTGTANIGAHFGRRPVQESVDYYISNGFPANEERSTSGVINSGMTVYYTGGVYPFESQYDKILTVNYYDTYPQGSPTAPVQVLGQNVLPQDTQSSSVSTKSLPVASYIKNIEDDNWTKNYTYYDTKGRVISTHSINHLGGYTKTESELDFAGIPQKTNMYHLRKTGEIGVTIKERFVYDTQNRLLQHYHQVDDQPEVLLAENTYNELSQLTNKKVGNDLQSIDYAYSIRGWMTDINKNQMGVADLGGKLFSYKIKYNQKDGIDNPDSAQFSGKNVTPKYNGNIAEIDWRAVETLGVNPSITPKRYGYAYDSLNRLTAGYYQNPNNPYSKENTESLSYDLNGNILGLYRTSVMENGNTTATLIDNLQYTYQGNRLTQLADISNNSTGYEAYTSPVTTINYDGNGNMLNMPGKAITGIQYNYLNLPKQMDLNTGFPFTSSYVYGADGRKVKKTTVSTVSGYYTTTVTTENMDYLDGFQYKHTQTETLGGNPGDGEAFAAPMETSRAMEMQAYSPESTATAQVTAAVKTEDLQFFPTAEGFYDYIKDQYIYQYKDHLGNVRVSFARNSAGALQIVDANDYYPFGMNHLKTGNAYFGQSSYKNYKYNNKELQETGMYDYGARMYMPDIGRWGVVDPLAEQYRRWSPFNYALNNPIRFIDPDGRGTEDFVQRKDGSIYWDKNANSQATTKAGETYLGKTLNFNFNSYIDPKSWDGPMGSLPAGDKLTSIITLTARENEQGELTSLVGTSNVELGKTFGRFKGRDYYPGEGGSNNVFDVKSTSAGIKVNFEQHASVPSFEEAGLNSMGFKIVDVAQKLDINYNSSNGNLSVGAYTDVFPSATLKLNGGTIMQYNQPSFTGTHTAPTTGITSTPRGTTAPKRDLNYYLSKFYKRN